MSDPILLLLTVDTLALLLLGAGAGALPFTTSGFLTTLLSGLGLLLCLPPLLLGSPGATFSVPIGPPGLSLHLALDSLSGLFLALLFLAGTAIAAFQATEAPPPAAKPARMTAFCLAGAALSLLAADGVTLAIGLAVMAGALSLPRQVGRNPAALLVPFLSLSAVCLVTPSGFAPRFDAIRASPVDPSHATAAAALAFAAVAILTFIGSSARCWTRDALTAGVLIPSGSYLLLRLIADLAGAAAQSGFGFLLVLAGGAVAIVQGWSAGRHPEIDQSVAHLARRQAGLATAGIGLALVARSVDLPGAELFTLAATVLAVVAASVGGVLTSLATKVIGANTGTKRVSSLGGLILTMPATSVALTAGLVTLSALPPGVGFASLWLLFEAILSAPRTGGLLFQLPLALISAALALSAALATATSVRLIGVVLLGRPRTPQASGAQETKSQSRTILLALAGLSASVGALPGPVIWLLADPAIRTLTGAPPGARIGLTLLLPSVSSPSYLALPVLALLVLATGAAMLIPRWCRNGVKAAGLWADGMTPPNGLPFGDPAAQSTGGGFLPVLPDLPPLRLPRFPMPWSPRPPSANFGLWLILAAFGALLLLLAFAG